MTDRELNVLRQQVELPAVGFVQNTLGEQEARPAHGGAAAQPVPRAVQIAALPQEPQGVAGADPVVGIVLAVAVAGDDLVPAGEHGVHPLDVVRRQHIVRVEHEIAVEAVGIVGLDVLSQKVQGVALAHVDVIEPLIHHGAAASCDVGGAVGAVVRHHEHREQRGIIRLLPQTVQKTANDGSLVPRRDEHSIAVGRGRAGKGALLFGQHQRYVEELIGIADKKQRRDQRVHGPQSSFHERHFLSFSVSPMVEKKPLRNKEPPD